MPFSAKGCLQRLQTLVALIASPCLQNGPQAVVHWIEVGRIGRPLRSSDKVGQVILAPLLRRFRRVLLKGPMLFPEVRLSPRKQFGLEDVPLVGLLVDFDALINEDQGRLAAGTNAGPDHNRSGILAALDDGRGSWRRGRPPPVVLVIVRLLHREELLVREDDALPLLTYVPTEKSFASLEPHALVVVGEELDFLELVGFEPEVLFGYSADRLPMDSGIAGDFPH